MEKFRCLALAFEAIKKGGNMPCILNAANEVVNRAFLEDRCGFMQMAEIIENTMDTIPFKSENSLEDYLECDAEARRVAASFIK